MLHVKPFGVLGKQLLANGREVLKGRDPSTLDSCCIVDPAGLHHIVPPGGPLGAGGAAGAVYRWLGISQSTMFTADVIEGVQKTGDAKYKLYERFRFGIKDKHVIHAVGPDLRNNHETEEAMRLLTSAYHQIFLEFLVSGQRVLRLLPVSAGIFAGSFAPDMPRLTLLAMHAGFGQLPPMESKALLERELHLCVFMEKELPLYQAAAQALHHGGLAGLRAMKPGQTATRVQGGNAPTNGQTPGLTLQRNMFHAFEDNLDDIVVDLGQHHGGGGGSGGGGSVESEPVSSAKKFSAGADGGKNSVGNNNGSSSRAGRVLRPSNSKIRSASVDSALVT